MLTTIALTMELELNSFKKLDTFTLSSTSVVAEFKFGGDVEDVTDAVENIASSFGDSSHYEIRLLMKKTYTKLQNYLSLLQIQADEK